VFTWNGTGYVGVVVNENALVLNSTTRFIMIEKMCVWPWVHLLWRYNLISCPVILILIIWC
jgi:hypothetical protein